MLEAGCVKATTDHHALLSCFVLRVCVMCMFLWFHKTCLVHGSDVSEWSSDYDAVFFSISSFFFLFACVMQKEAKAYSLTVRCPRFIKHLAVLFNSYSLLIVHISFSFETTCMGMHRLTCVGLPLVLFTASVGKCLSTTNPHVSRCESLPHIWLDSAIEACTLIFLLYFSCFWLWLLVCLFCMNHPGCSTFNLKVSIEQVVTTLNHAFYLCMLKNSIQFISIIHNIGESKSSDFSQGKISGFRPKYCICV